MLKPSRIQAISVTLVGILSLPVRAEVIPGRWEKIVQLAMATPITVDLKNGDRLKGYFEGLSESEIFLRTAAAGAGISKGDVERIFIRPDDSVDNGTVIGAAIGGGSVLIVADLQLPASDPIWPIALFYTAIATGVGAHIGYVVDANVKKQIVLYQAP